MRRPYRNPTYRLRRAVDSLPRHTKQAMLHGIDSNRIIVGAYVDPTSGGICPMLAAHRNGERTSVASFARAWDAYTGAKRPRRATRREVRTLRSLLEQSLDLDASPEQASIAELAAQIRAEREQLAGCATTGLSEEPTRPTADPVPAHDSQEPQTSKQRIRRRREAPYLDLLAIAEAALAEQGVWARADERDGAQR